jgi:hypothetical protein
MWAALLTSQVKLSPNIYLAVMLWKEMRHVSPQHIAGTTMGRMKQEKILRGKKYLQKHQNYQSTRSRQDGKYHKNCSLKNS